MLWAACAAAEQPECHGSADAQAAELDNAACDEAVEHCCKLDRHMHQVSCVGGEM